MKDARTISVGKGKAAIIDAADFDWLSQFKWHVTDRGYAIASHKGKRLTMHRLILETPKGMVSDHINGNRLDNRRGNLRIATYAENARNKGNQAHTSIYKGVGWKKDNNLWQVRIHIGDKWHHVGLYEEEIAAAVAYNEKAIEVFGEHARLNVIPADWKPTEKSAPYNLKGVTSHKKAIFKGKVPSSKYKGVSRVDSKWKAMIKKDGIFHYLGRFTSEEDAALVYNKKAKEFWGDRAWQNPLPESHHV